MSKIGKYVIEEEVGHGGFGQVLRAYDPSVGRRVAIKILRSGSDPNDLARFRIEAVAAGNLHHKNIVTVYEFGEENGIAYLVMEYLEGQNLQRVIESHSIDNILQKMQIMSQIAEGLHCAHLNGVVHRDVKPANIMVLADGTVKIMDFGIARLLHAAKGATLTQAGFLVGSVQYMSPEQFRDQPIDALCDIWSYGVMYYEFLAEQHPFRGPDPPAIMFKIVSQEPVPIEELAPDCPAELADVIARAMSKDRDSRYQSLQDLRIDTQPILMNMQRQHADMLLQNAQDLAAQEDWGAVQTAVRQILELDSGNAAARQLRDVARQKTKRLSVKPRIEALLSKGGEQLSRREFQEAIGTFESALRLDTSDSQARAWLEQAQGRLEQNKRASGLVKEARQALNARDLTSAFGKANEALLADPGSPEAQSMLTAIEAEFGRREEDRAIAREVERINALSLARSFDEAEAAVRELRARYVGVAAVEDAYRRLSERKARFETEQRLQSAIGEAKDLLRRELFAQAEQRINTALIDFPDQDELKELLGHARQRSEIQRRLEALNRLRSEAERHIVDQEFDAALHDIDMAAKMYPGDTALLDLMQVARRGKAAQKRENDIAAALRRAEEQARASALPQAIETLSQALVEYPDDSRLREVSQRLNDKLQRERRAETIRLAVSQAVETSKRGDIDGAIGLLESSSSQYPDSKELRDALDIARRTKATQEEQIAVADAVRGAARLEDENQLEAALAVVETALRNYPASDVLKRSAERMRQRVADEDRKKSVSRERAAIENLLAQERFEDALSRAEAACRANPGEDVFTGLVARAKAACEAVRQRFEWRVRTSLQSGNVEQAEEALTTGLRLIPGDATLAGLSRAIEVERECKSWLLKADAALGTGDFDNAETAAKEALALSRDHARARDALANITRERQEFERRRRIEEALRKARIWAGANNFDAARRELTAFRDLFPDAIELRSEMAQIDALEDSQREKAAQEKAAREKAERERLERERLAREKAEQEKAARERAEQEKTARQKAERERADRERLAREAARLAQEREKAEREQTERVTGDLQHGRTRTGSAPGGQTAAAAALARDLTLTEVREIGPGLATQQTSVERQRRRKLIQIMMVAGPLTVVAGIGVWIAKTPSVPARFQADVTAIVASGNASQNEPFQETVHVQSHASREFNAVSNAAWIRVTPAHAKTPSTLTVSLDPALLPAGDHNGMVSIRATDGSTVLDIPVSLSIPASPLPLPAPKPVLVAPSAPAPVVLTFAPRNVLFEYEHGSALPVSRSIDVSSGGQTVPFTAIVNRGAEWLEARPMAGSAPGKLQVRVKPNRLTAGKYEGEIALTNASTKERQLLPVTLRIAAAPQLSPQPHVSAVPQPPAAQTTPPVVHPSPGQTTTTGSPAAPASPATTLPPAAPPQPQRYGGAPAGIIRWTGVLPPKTRLEIHSDKASLGSVRGHLPGVDAHVQVTEPADSVSVEAQPSAADRYQSIVLVNNGSSVVDHIDVRWRIK